jgi:uncharacterized integral membrane protein
MNDGNRTELYLNQVSILPEDTLASVILVIIVIVIVALFSVQNAMPVAISFLTWQFNASLALIALLFLLASMITGMRVLSWVQMRRRSTKKRAEEKKPPAGGKLSDLK